MKMFGENDKVNSVNNDNSDNDNDSSDNEETQKGYSVELFLKAVFFLGRSFYTPDEEYRLNNITPVVGRIPTLSFCERLVGTCDHVYFLMKLIKVNRVEIPKYKNYRNVLSMSGYTARYLYHVVIESVYQYGQVEYTSLSRSVGIPKDLVTL